MKKSLFSILAAVALFLGLLALSNLFDPLVNDSTQVADGDTSSNGWSGGT